MKKFMVFIAATLLFVTNVYAMGPEHTGSWNHPDQSGHGFLIEFGDLGNNTPLMVIYWYFYDTEGYPVFHRNRYSQFFRAD